MEIYKRDMIESIPIGLISLDQSGHIETFNRVAAKLLGLDAESAIGKKLQEVLNCDLELLLKPVSETHEFTTDCQRSDGTVIPVSLTFSRVTGSNGNDLGSLFIIRDMRQIASLERRVERSERLASLGRMAAGIAHEVRNPLSSIKGFAQYFRDMFEVGSPDYENAALMVKEADRLNRVIEELLHFARPLELEIQMIQLNPVISHAVRLISSDIHSRNIGLRVDIAATESLRILADNDKFIQVLLNLMINSLDSIEVEGELTISTAVREDDVLIEIKDTGRGIASENIQRIFDPFYTTKKDGTGLGLAIVYRIIEQMKGDIKVQSSQNEGTSFFIMFDKM
jgi:two-component system sensor histidine kinase HydH